MGGDIPELVVLGSIAKQAEKANKRHLSISFSVHQFLTLGFCPILSTCPQLALWSWCLVAALETLTETRMVVVVVSMCLHVNTELGNEYK